MGGVLQVVHDIGRMRHIVSTLARYGFGYLVQRLHLGRSIAGRAFMNIVPGKALAGLPFPVRLRRLLEDLGPSFIKFGQVLSMRPDLVSPDVARELEKLQDRVERCPLLSVRERIAEELGRPADELFAAVALKPVACASLAQVYEALLFDGRRVVLKVQRPGMEDTLRTDGDILYELARLAERHIEELRPFDPVGIVDEFFRTAMREIDFEAEARTIDRFRRYFAHDETVVIPEVFHNLSSRRLLTLEKINGIRITEVHRLRRAGIDCRLVADRFARAVLAQIFEHGVFHADLHAGNVLVTPGGRIAFIDFGMIGRLNRELQEGLTGIIAGFVHASAPEIREALFRLGTVEKGVDTRRLEDDIAELVEWYIDRPLEEVELSAVIAALIELVSRYRIRLPSEFYLLSRTLMGAEAALRKLDPGFVMANAVRPFVREWQRRQRSPERLLGELRDFSVYLLRVLRALPGDVTDIVAQIKRGTLRVEFEHRGLENFTLQLSRAFNRISFSFIVAALIVGSSIIMQVNWGPRYFGLPVLGFAGFVIAGILGLWLIIVILRSGII